MIFRTLERLLHKNAAVPSHRDGDVLSTEERLETVTRILAALREFEEFCDKHPTTDELTLLAEFARLQEVTTSAVDDREVRQAIDEGLRCLVANQQSSGGWGWPVPRRLTREAFDATAGSSDVAITWDTAIALLALADGSKHSFKKSDEFYEALANGREWLLAAQGEKDGGWAELGPRYLPAERLSWAVETGVALWALGKVDAELGTTTPAKVWRAGLKLFADLQFEGATRARRDKDQDTKASAMAIMIHLGPRDISAPLVGTNAEWLLRKNDGGDWGPPPEGHFIDPAFYAVSALQAYQTKATMSPGQSGRIEGAIRSTVDWYLDQARFTRAPERGGPGWAWRDVENTAAALAALLNFGVPALLPSVQRGIQWLLDQRKEDDAWGSETPIAVVALLRYIKPGSRLPEALSERTRPR